jgi:hypothetical protein
MSIRGQQLVLLLCDPENPKQSPRSIGESVGNRFRKGGKSSRRVVINKDNFIIIAK